MHRWYSIEHNCISELIRTMKSIKFKYACILLQNICLAYSGLISISLFSCLTWDMICFMGNCNHCITEHISENLASIRIYYTWDYTQIKMSVVVKDLEYHQRHPALSIFIRGSFLDGFELSAQSSLQGDSCRGNGGEEGACTLPWAPEGQAR